MAISFADLKRVKSTEPPRILLYGPEKGGKTTLAAEFPGAVFLQTEEGIGTLELSTFGKLQSFQDVMDAMASLYQEEHAYKTVVVDSVTALQLAECTQMLLASTRAVRAATARRCDGVSPWSFWSGDSMLRTRAKVA